MDKIKIGILRGGIEEHYRSSLQKGGDIISHIFKNLSDKYKVVDILIDKNGVWHINGLPVIPADLVHRVDIVWNTSKYPGLSSILNNFSILNIGNNSFLKSLENNREMLQTYMKRIGIKMPRSIILPLYQENIDGPKEKYIFKKVKEIFEKFPSPWIVKSYTKDTSMGPVRSREGSQRLSTSNGMGIHLAKTFEDLVNAIKDGVEHKKSILIEEFILGKNSSIHSISNFRGKEVYIFPLINKKNNSQGLSSSEKEMLYNKVVDLHKHLDIEHYLKSDFILDIRGSIYLSSISFSLDLENGSDFEESCGFIGLKIHNIIDNILENVLDKKNML